jgi:hypothetical protein
MNTSLLWLKCSYKVSGYFKQKEIRRLNPRALVDLVVNFRESLFAIEALAYFIIERVIEHLSELIPRCVCVGIKHLVAVDVSDEILDLSGCAGGFVILCVWYPINSDVYVHFAGRFERVDEARVIG